MDLDEGFVYPDFEHVSEVIRKRWDVHGRPNARGTKGGGVCPCLKQIF
jgi:hypothetical protein